MAFMQVKVMICLLMFFTPSGPTLASRSPTVVRRNLVGNFFYRFLMDCPCTPFVFLRVGSALKSQ